MTLENVATVELLTGMVGVIVFTILYGVRSQWWRYVEGRALMAKSTSLALISMLSGAFLIFGDYPGRMIVRVVVFGLFMISSWFFVVALVRRQHKTAVERQELIDEYVRLRREEKEAEPVPNGDIELPSTIRGALRARILRGLEDSRDR